MFLDPLLGGVEEKKNILIIFRGPFGDAFRVRGSGMLGFRVESYLK
jgi:hypothetical protein